MQNFPLQKILKPGLPNFLASVFNPCYTLFMVGLFTTASLFTVQAQIETTETFEASLDNTIFSENDNSNGIGSHLFAGRTNMGDDRRALVQFDISSIPSDAVITGAILRLTGNKQGPNEVTLHRVTTMWNEGTSNAPGQEGMGTGATTNDATWNFAVFNTVAWTNPGGDFVGNSSDEGNISQNNTTQFMSAGILSDVVGWHDGTNSNFGWIAIGEENANNTAIRMSSREGSSPPELEITYTVDEMCDVFGGQVLIENDGIAVTFCTGDGEDDIVNAISSGASGPNGVWIITDESDNFLDVSNAPPFNFESQGPGTCLIYFLSFEDGLVGLAEGNNISDLEGCFDLSNSITVTRNSAEGGTIEIEGGDTERTLCVGDGITDVFNVVVSGNEGENSMFVVTNSNGLIISLTMTNTFDFENAGPGMCQIWNLSYSGDIEGLSILDPIDQVEGCFDLSNPITLNRNSVEGGQLSIEGGETSITICAGDGMTDEFNVVLEGNSGSNSAWVITDEELNILDLPEGPPFDLEAAGEGVCLIWHLSYEDGLTGAEVDMNLSGLDGCYELSNAITVTRIIDGEPCAETCDADGGSIEIEGSGTELSICAGDGVSDAFDVALDGAVGTNSAWVITDEEANILGLPEGPPFDLENEGAGVCLIWHLSFEEGLVGAEIGLNANDLVGCFDLSNPITVTRVVEGELCIVPETYKAILTGTQQVFPVLSKGYGEIEAVLTGTTLEVSGQFSGMTGNFDVNIGGGAHIHEAPAGRNGGVEISLDATLADDLTMGSFSTPNNTFELTADQIEALQNRNLYINIHTSEYASGELRGQLVPQADMCLHTNLLGSNQVPSIVSHGAGGLIFEVDGNQLTVSGSFDDISSEIATAIAGGAHIHNAISGRSGGVEVSLNLTPDDDNLGAIVEAANNSFELTDEQMELLMSEQMYVNVHSMDFQSGELRGQIAKIAASTFRADLTGVQQVPALMSDGSGRLLINYNGDGQITVSGSVNNLSSAIAVDIAGGAHLHMGFAGRSGGVQFPLVFTNDDSNQSGIFLAEDNTFEISDLQLDALCGREMYANVHSENFTSGELRGQVLPLAKAYFGTNLLGVNSVQPVHSTGVGDLQFELTDNQLTVSGGFTNLNGDFDAAVAGGSHIHIGPPSGTGSILTNLSADLDTDLKGGVYGPANNHFELTDEQVDELLAGNTYINIHTTEVGSGEIRGQVLRDDNLFPLEGFTITAPQDGFEATIGMTDLTLSWESTSDPDGDDVVYIWQLSQDEDFSTIAFQENVETETQVAYNASDFEALLADAGIEVGDTTTFYVRVLASDGSVHKISDTISLILIPDCPAAINGGEIEIDGGGTELTICAGDGESDEFDVVLEGNIGTNSAWIITDADGNILDLPDGPPFDLEGAGVGVCLIWHLSFEDGLTGAVVDSNIANLGGCFDLGNAITVTRVDAGDLCVVTCDADGGTVSGGPYTFCVGDGIVDNIPMGEVIFEDDFGDTSVWVVTDETATTILGLPGVPSDVDFDGAGAGICLVWNLSYSGEITGLEVDSLISGLEGCFSFSANSVTVTRLTEGGPCAPVCDADGGMVSGGPYTFCVGDGIVDNIPMGEVIFEDDFGDTSVWVVTDETATTILGLPGVPSDVDFDGAGAGICLVWNLSYSGEITGLEVDSLISDLEGCFSFSANSVTVTRLTEGGPCAPVCDADGGTVSGGPYTFCVGDGIVDNIPMGEVIFEDDFGDTSVWVVTDETATTILGLPGVPSDVDFDGAGAGICLVWNLSYSGEITGLEVDSLISDLEGCFSFSANSVTVTRLTEGGPCAPVCEVDGGEIEIDGGGTELTICADDGISDAFDIALTGNVGTNSAWVITDEGGTILGLPNGPPIDLEGAGPGVCLVWHLSFEDGLTGVEMGLNANNLDGCFDLSNPITVTRLTGEDCEVPCDVAGGTIEVEGMGTEITLCVDDGQPDLIDVVVDGAVGDSMKYIISDEIGIILALTDALPFDFEGSGAGVCRIWKISYSSDLIGLMVGKNTADLDGCYELSNPIVITRNVGSDCEGFCEAEGGMIEIDGGGTETTICIADDEADIVDVVVDGEGGADNTAWIVTNAAIDEILKLPVGGSIDFTGTGTGTCLIWHLSYDDGLMGLEVGANPADLVGCFDLSNEITVNRVDAGEPCPPECNAEGGEIEIDGGGTETTICVGDDVEDIVETTVQGEGGADNSGWIVTNAAVDEILGLPGNGSISFAGTGTGTCLIWHISYDDGLSGLEVGANPDDLEGCFDLSNAVTVIRVDEGDPCPLGCQPPDPISVTNISGNLFVLDWAPVEGAETYRVEARYKGKNKWKERVLRFGSRATIGARKGSTVEVRVQTICLDGTTSDFTDIITVEVGTTKNKTGSDLYAEVEIWEDSQNGMHIFPNPTVDRFTINYTPDTDAELSVFNLAGQRVLTQVMKTGETIHQVYVGDLQEGVYVMTIREKGAEIKRERIIKM